MKKLRRFAVGLLWSASASAAAFSANAQGDLEATRRLPSALRDQLRADRSSYNAKGLPIGAFRAFPELRLEGLYDDNVFRSEAAARHDLIFRVAPSVVMRSEWSRHKLSLEAALESLKFRELSTEDVLNWNVGATGQLDIVRAAYIAANVNYSQLHEPRSSPDDQLGIEPTPFKKLATETSIHFKPNRFGVVLSGTYTRYDYDPVEASAPPGGALPNNDRDRNIYVGRLRVSYDFASVATFVEGAYEAREFDQSVDRFGLRRDSTGYAIRGGFAAQLDRLLEGEIYVGYIHRAYQGLLPDVSGLDFAANLTWYATPLTTIRLEAGYRVSDTTFALASASSDRSVKLLVDHELLRNLLLRANVGYLDSDYQGFAREDQVWNAGVGADYLINRYLSLNVAYNYESRSSTAIGQDFSANIISFGLRAQL